MITDIELVKSGGEVQRVAREKISMETIECPINLYTIRPMNLVCTPQPLVRLTYQKGNVSIFEEVFVVSYELFIGWIGALVVAG